MSSSGLITHLSDAALSAKLLGILIILLPVAHIFYNLCVHPLRKIPGPKLAAVTRLVWVWHVRNGSLVKHVNKLHRKYGEVVRIAPNEVSFISGETAWSDIYGSRYGKQNKGHYLKDPMFYPVPPSGVNSIIAATEEDHIRQRKVVSHAFSEKALREQEGIVRQYVDLLILRLHEQVSGPAKGKVDMMRWFNYLTFDVIADLTFGEPFHCLRDTRYHPWVYMTFQVMKSFGIMSIKRHYPLWAKFTALFETPAALKLRKEFFTFVDEKVDSRISVVTTRPDFMTAILRKQGEPTGMSRNEIESTLNSFMVAGSETAATTLAGVTFYLTRNPEKLRKLQEEVRGKFRSDDEITMKEALQLPYLTACLNESLRLYPPVPTGFPRVVPKGGDVISGYYMPEKTSVYMSQFPANHSDRNFTNPDDFVPERWFKEGKYANDNFSVFNPFSYGTRDCLGKNLAAGEMRLTIAKFVWHFDMDLHPDVKGDWTDQKVYTVWERPPLPIQIRPVDRAL